MLVHRWSDEFKSQYGGEWPGHYLAYDVETTGFKRDKDLVVEVGHCLVEDNALVDQLSVVVDWSQCADVDQDWLRWKLNYTRDEMAKDGKKYGMTYARLQEEGIAPAKALGLYAALFDTLRESNFVFASHGAFDEAMLAYSFSRAGLNEKFSLPDARVFDTSAIEKGGQLLQRKDISPYSGESARAYFKRLSHMRANGVHSSLDTHCAQKYHWAEKGLDMSKAHTAGFDAYLVHLLMQEVRSITSIDSGPAPLASPARPASPYAPGRFRRQRNR